MTWGIPREHQVFLSQIKPFHKDLLIEGRGEPSLTFEVTIERGIKVTRKKHEIRETEQNTKKAKKSTSRKNQKNKRLRT